MQQVSSLPGVNFNLAAVDLGALRPQPTNKYLADKALRQAIFTAVNRQEIIDKTVGAFYKKAAPLNSHNFDAGNQGYKDYISPPARVPADSRTPRRSSPTPATRSRVASSSAKDGAPVPPLRFRYTTGNTLRQQSGELLAGPAEAARYRRSRSSRPTSLGGTLNSGDFDIIIFAWVGSPFIGGNEAPVAHRRRQQLRQVQQPRGRQAARRRGAGARQRPRQRDLLNQADELMAKDAYVLPLFQKPAFIAVYTQVLNVRNNPSNCGYRRTTSRSGARRPELACNTPT